MFVVLCLCLFVYLHLYDVHRPSFGSSFISSWIIDADIAAKTMSATGKGSFMDIHPLVTWVRNAQLTSTAASAAAALLFFVYLFISCRAGAKCNYCEPGWKATVV